MLNLELLSGEQTIKLFRQSLWVLFWPLCSCLALAIFPLYLLQKYELFLEFWKILLGWILILFILAFFKYIFWLLTVLIITNQRLVFIKYNGILSKQIFDPNIRSLSHISVESKGLNGLIGLKTLNITIGGAAKALQIPSLRKAEKIKQIILSQTTSV